MWWMANKEDCIGMLTAIADKIQWIWSEIMARKKRIKPRFWFMMMVVMLIAFGVVYLTEANYMEGQRANIAKLTQERNQLLAENATIERKIAFSKTDEYIERTARSELGLLKPGEVRFVAGSEASTANGQ